MKFSEIDMKLQNEVKVTSEDIYTGDPLHTTVANFVKELFSDNLSGNIDFNCNKDWNISVAIKTNEEGVRRFTGSIKMTDVSVTGQQLNIFHTEEEVPKWAEKKSKSKAKAVSKTAN